MSALERTKVNPLPLYHQLKEILKQQICSGHLAPHTPIPSEPKLIANYHVSRATVRQALTELVYEGWLYRKRGTGTFVNARISLTEMLSMQREIPGKESQKIQKNLESLIAYGQQLEASTKEREQP